MNVKGFVCLLAGLFVGFSAFSQKVKYKDLIVLLNARQYEQAELPLKRYLQENKDNASAYLFMGMIYHEKSIKNDVLRETSKLISNIDSAVIFYEKAQPLITEKEVKKNEEYYQSYSRRDIRTGEFGIAQSDIILDVEERIKGLKNRKEKINDLKKYFQLAEAQYLRAGNYYKELQERFVTKKELYLLSDDEMIISLDKLTQTFDSCLMSFKNYKSVLTSPVMGKTSYNQTLNLQEIKDFKKDGITPADFMENDLKLWDYSEWSKKTIRTIRDEVYPARKDLLMMDTDINKLRGTVVKDSIVADLSTIINNPGFNEMKKWDNDPMPIAVFNLKLKEIEYLSEEISKSKLKGGENIQKRMNLIKKQMLTLKSLDSMAVSLSARDWRRESACYKNYISGAYGTITVLNNYIHSMKEFSKRELGIREKELNDLVGSLKWMIDENDSIPLFKDVAENSLYHPMVITENYTSGVKLMDSTSVGYFFTITPARMADLKINFQIDSLNVSARSISLIKGIASNTNEPAYFIALYSQSKVNGKTPVQIVRISKKSGMEWSSYLLTDYAPVELKFTSSNGELLIRTVNTDGDTKMVVIAKDGKRLQ